MPIQTDIIIIIIIIIGWRVLDRTDRLPQTELFQAQMTAAQQTVIHQRIATRVQLSQATNLQRPPPHLSEKEICKNNKIFIKDV